MFIILHVFHWPRKSPDLNPIEKWWRSLTKCFSGKPETSMIWTLLAKNTKSRYLNNVAKVFGSLTKMSTSIKCKPEICSEILKYKMNVFEYFSHHTPSIISYFILLCIFEYLCFYLVCFFLFLHLCKYVLFLACVIFYTCVDFN